MTGFTDPVLLRELRDIHTPDPAFLWPPAPGWWLLGTLLLILTTLGLLFRYRRGALGRVARKELQGIRLRFSESKAPGRLALELSMLLRRVALVRFPRHEVAGLHGSEWLAFLDRSGGDGAFSKGPGRALSEAPFQASADCDGDELLQLAERWLEHNT